MSIERPAAVPKGGLRGRRVLITRPAGQARRLVEALEDEGAQAVTAPAIRIEPPASWEDVDRAIRDGGYDWVIFTSANGVRAFWGRLNEAHRGADWFAGARIAAIGPETARALTTIGVRPDLVPDEYVAEALIACLADAGPLDGMRVLLPRTDIARETLAVGLRDRGAVVDQVATYRTVTSAPPPGLLAQLRAGEIDAVTFTSSSTVRGLLEMLGGETDALNGVVVACIGPVTADTARSLGLHPAVVAHTYTAEGLVTALRAYFAAR
ncbi:MAG TPA: uroporphyrinogen-III synthase [Chloroflexota bacterium]|nr:uroporphyrinogen-III synthase [Chloroflexota bacterium]